MMIGHKAVEGLPSQSTGPTAPRNYDIMPDGRHFVGIVSSGQGQLASPQINVIIEWFTELRQRTEPKSEHLIIC